MESILPLLAQTQKASIQICNKTTSEKKALLASLATKLQENVEQIMAANRLDLDKMDDSNPKKDRLLLNENRIKDLAESLISITQLADPSGKILSEYKAENGLLIQKIAVPVGVVGVIYEARPNVTIDVAALCMYAGNAVVLRGGSDAEHTNSKLVQVIHDTLDEHKWDKNGVQLLPVERKFVSQLLTAVRYVDIIIPRGSQQLIDFVRDNAKVPTIETGAGVCHTYVEQSANLDMAAQIVVNAKTQRPSVCNALDTVLVDVAIAEQFLPKLLPGFLPFEVEIFADYEAYDILKEANYPYLKKATDDNFGMEYLAQKCSIKIVENTAEALEHIRNFSSKHSEAIITENKAIGELFLKSVDAAAVYVNASTRFTDGGCFGLGAEIGISTQKLHARGPFALEKLTTEKWVIHGQGQIR